jgi:hypothetical protein
MARAMPEHPELDVLPEWPTRDDRLDVERIDDHRQVEFRVQFDIDRRWADEDEQRASRRESTRSGGSRPARRLPSGLENDLVDELRLGRHGLGLRPVISGVHAIIFTRDAEADRAFFRDVLELRSVDAGNGWLIFSLPPAELAAHPIDGDAHHELYLMCEDVATVEEMSGKGVEFTSEISDEAFGLMTALRLPGGSDLALYEPRHPSPLSPNG